MRTRWAVVAVAALAAPLAACGPKHSPTPPAGMNISGDWVLNADVSEAVPGGSWAESRGETRSGRPRGGGGGGDRGEWGRIGGIGGEGRRSAYGPGGILDPDAVHAAFTALRERPAKLSIRQASSIVALASDGGPALELVPDGRKRMMPFRSVAERRDSSEVKAYWDESGLVVERSLEHRLTVKRHYEHAPGSPRLIVTTEVQGMPRKMESRAVYDAASGA